MNQEYNRLKYELHEELENILNYWCKNTIDEQYGGFHGRINHQNKLVEKASKGIILNTRILWSFSAAANYQANDQYVALADRAFHYLKDHFLDSAFGGLYWELNYLGKPINKRKQVYAQAFGIYALSEYFRLTQLPEAKELALTLFHLIEKNARDREKGGYLEAFDEDWSAMEDMRLSHKDMNVAKTMNTHLHVLEAYTTLYQVSQDAEVGSALQELITLFLKRFYDPKHQHYHLFFDENWQLKSKTISYGHDIETAWLVMEAAHALNDMALSQKAEHVAMEICDTFLKEALDDDDAVINEKNYESGELDTDRHWWPQMEAVVGLAFAYKMSWKQHYASQSVKIWEFTKKHLIDHQHGEWHFRVDQLGAVYTEEDKVSMWKAPYHTTRACIMVNSI